MEINKLKNKKILILGFGREGQDTFLFLRKLFPKKTLGIADVAYNIQYTPKETLRVPTGQARYKIQNVDWHLGKNYLKSLENYDVVIKSPGIPFKILPKPQLKKIITQTDIFFENCPGIIIGVTGTKGKSTTSSLIYQIMNLPRRKRRGIPRRAGYGSGSFGGGNTPPFRAGMKAAEIKAEMKKDGKNVYLIGNIEKPVLSFLKKAKSDDIFVYELSSHQLYNLKRSPHIAVFLNLFREHLDYYKNFQEYARAKINITLHQNKNDYLVFNAGDKTVSNFARKSKAKKIPIKGEYYELDKNAARAVGRIFKIPEEIIEKSIKQFKPLEHRLELVGTFKGITFYNDALATIPEATMAAIDYLGDRVETIMLGGFDRKINFDKLAKKVLQSKIKTAILFPTTGKKIWNEIKKSGRVLRLAQSKKLPKHFFVNDMEKAVKLAYQHTNKEKICLLSTASSSFSIFKDYKEKGDLFKKFVKKFGHAR